MAGYRAFGDRMLLKAEAEYRVRCGQSRADVSRELGVPLPTLAQWACQDGWRKKDLEAERGGGALGELGDRLLRLRAVGRLEADEREAAVRAIADEMGWAKKGVRALVSEESWVRRMAVVEAELDAKAARAVDETLERRRRDSEEWAAGRGVSGGASGGRLAGEDADMSGTTEVESEPESGSGAPEIIRRWHKVALERLPDEIGALLADDVVFESPVVHTPQQGKAITEKYLRGALAVLNGPDFAYRDEWYKARSAVLEFTTKIDGITINGVDIIHWNEEGQITQFRVMLRPLKAIQTVHAAMGAWLQANS